MPAPLLAASTLGSDPPAVQKALLIGAFLALTTPIVAHVIGRAAYLERGRMATPGAIDESRADLEHGMDAPARSGAAHFRGDPKRCSDTQSSHRSFGLYLAERLRTWMYPALCPRGEPS